MPVFEFILALLLAGVVLALLAPRLRLPWPVLLAAAGACLAVAPGLPTVSLDPRLALALFVAPVLLDAAYDASPRDLRQNWLPVLGLVLGAVGVTVAAVFLAARHLDPALPWPAALALGAIVAPPDALAAAAILRDLGLPHRVRVILQGESLLNDASALLIYRFALGAAAGAVTVWTAPLLLGSIAGGILLGWGAARVYLRVMHDRADGAPAVVLQFLGTFGVWLLADACQLSAILTLIAYGMTLGRAAPERTGARLRRESYAVWEVATFVLNILAFVLISLQMRTILAHLGPHAAGTALFALAVLGAVMLSRIVWVMTWNTAVRWKNRRFGPSPRAPRQLPTRNAGVVIAWCGMRGVVTLAAALALPDHFPQRDRIVLAAYTVVLGTLLIQGLSLRPLIAALDLPRDDQEAEEIRLARASLARAAEAALGEAEDSATARLLREEYAARGASGGGDPDPTGLARLRRRALAAERAELLALRRTALIGDDAFHAVEEDLDWSEAAIERRLAGDQGR